jgi:lysosomal Pro-X carboxypeptidase
MFHRNFASTDTGRAFLTSKLNSQFNEPNDWKNFYDYMDGVIWDLTMANYPYPADFLGNLPANPVREFCSRLSEVKTNDEDLVSAVGEALKIYPKSKELELTSGKTFSFQRCTQKIVPMCTTGVHDMFLPSKWDFEQYSNECHDSYGVYPQEKAVITRYASQNWEGTSNIIFSNGLLDPWSGAGFLRSFNQQIDIVLIPEGAHHIDLRSDDPLDPVSVRMARKFHMNKFRQWISSHAATLSLTPKKSF